MMDTLFLLKEEAGLSNRDVAALLNVTPVMVQRYKNGVTYRNKPRLIRVVGLIKLLIEKGYLPLQNHTDRAALLKKAWGQVAPTQPEVMYK
jgi:transcriptional regulator with XRE-family HTH domain